MATAYEKAKKNVKDTKKAKGIVQKQKKVTANDLKFSWEYDTLTKKATKGNLKDRQNLLSELDKKGLGNIYNQSSALLYDQQIQNLKNNLARVSEIEALESTQATQSKQFGDLSDIVSGLEDWKSTDFENLRQDLLTNTQSIADLNKLDFSGLGDIESNTSNVASLLTRVGDLEKLGGGTSGITSIGDVSGLENIIDGLQSQFNNLNIPDAPDLSAYSTSAETRASTKDQLDAAIAELGINQYMKTGDFDSRMSDRLEALKNTVTDQFGTDIASLNLDKVREDIDLAEGNLSKLGKKFAGLSSDVSWITDLGLQGLDTRFADQASDFSTSLSSAEDRFGRLLGGQTETLTNLIDAEKLNLQGSLDKFKTGAQTAREQLESRLSTEGSTARKALADQLEAQGYNIDNLSTQLLGYGDRLTDYQEQFRDDLTDLRGFVGTQRELELGKLESEIGQDRTADLRRTKQEIKEERLSDIEKMAFNIRQEYGDDLFDLSETFGKGQEESRLARQELGADIQDLFGRSLAQDVSVAGLTSNVGTLGENLDSLKSSFGDFKLDAATNLGNVQRALQGEIGDLSGSLTEGLSRVQTDYVDRILGTERAGAEAREGLRSDLTGAIGSEAAAREAGLQSAAEARSQLAEESSRGFQDVYKTREQAISDLSGRFGENLRAQEQSLGRRIDDTTKAFDEKIGRLGSMMNYRMLGDSAGGVKMRRSKAYKSGAINTGTGQLSRSMKLKTLNI